MSRVLRRPMFRGGYVDSEGTGITSGLTDNYSQDERVGFANGSSYFDVIGPYSRQFGTSIIDPVKEYEKRISQIQKETKDTGYMYDPSFLTTITPGRNMTLEEIELSTEKGKEDFIKNLQKQREAKIQNIVKTSENLPEEKRKSLFDYYGITSKDLKIIQKPTEKPTETDDGTNVDRNQKLNKTDFKTIYEDLLPIFKASVGPDQDEYTRQKYLELAKFGLNLLKPTPAGIKPSLLSSAAAAAEKPLEGYGAILEKEKQAAKVPEILALQQTMKLSEPGTVGKAIRDLVQTGVAKNEKEALNIYLKSDSASQKKIAMDEKQLIRSDLQGYEGLKGVKDQAIINQLADLIYKDPNLAYKIKGERSKYKPEAYEEGGIYIDKGKIVKYKKGQFYTVNEPGFKE